MNIQIKDLVGLPADVIISLVSGLMRNRPPKEGSFDYGFETHGAIGITFNYPLKFPIQVYQSNKRKNDNIKIMITIEKHTPFF